MSVLLYARTIRGAGKRLRDKMDEVVAGEGNEIFQSIDDLSDKLREPRNHSTLAVLLALSQKELMKIISLRPLLSGVQVIMILPDRRKQTIARGHTLGPRFLSYVDSDFCDVGAVLKKMIVEMAFRRDPPLCLPS